MKETQRLLDELEVAVEITASRGDGERATEWRKVSFFLEAQVDLLQVWLHLKEDDPHAAWESFVAADSAAQKACEVLPDFEPAFLLYNRIKAVEACVFPSQTFVSPSIVTNVAENECSICGTRGGCQHEPGQIYDGTLAHCIIHHIESVREVSVVTHPASKTRRVLTLGNMDALTLERLTGLDKVV